MQITKFLFAAVAVMPQSEKFILGKVIINKLLAK